MIIKYWNRISNWGVDPEAPIFEQKSILLLNQLGIFGIPLTILMGYMVAIMYNIYMVGVTIWFNGILFIFVLFLNSKGHTTISRYLISVLPPFSFVFASAYAKSIGISNSVIFYVNPKIGLLIVNCLVLFLFGYEKPKKFVLGMAIPVLSFLMFDWVHYWFGITPEKLLYKPEELSSITISTTGLLFFICVGVVLIQRINRTYEEKVRQQSLEIEKQRDELLEKNEEINQQKEELSTQHEHVLKLHQEVSIQKMALEEVNKDMTSSIQYAQRIQQAILPTDQLIRQALPESFILFKPRDIVSGDFYYFAEKGEQLILAAIDCTGHGVPGAFMSMIGNDLLDQIIHDKNILEPGLILNELHKGIRKALKQQDGQNKDGMDLSMVMIDRKEKILRFSGAKNPLVYIQEGELFQIKGDKMSIGGEQTEEERIFKTHTIELKAKTMCYLFSDGYQDQFGGEEKKKFMLSNMKDLFQKINSESMEQQKEILSSTIDQWIQEGKELQTDDILLIGFRL